MRWLALGILVAVLVAGCGNKASGANQVRFADGESVSLDLPEEQKPDEDGFVGAVSGVVIDDAVYPIPGASVAIVGRPLQAVADGDGLFSFLDIAPGLYTVQATKEGHATGLGTLNVKAGEVTKAVLMAPRLPYQAPYHVTHAFEEFRSASPLDGTRYHVVPLDLQPAGGVLESLWDGLQPTVQDPLQYVATPESNATRRLAASGPNPLRVDLAADWFPPDEYAIRVQVVPTQLTLPADAAGRTFVTLFYVEPPPADWSFVGGDA